MNRYDERIKRQSTQWGKLFAIYITGKITVAKWAKTLNRHFQKKNMKMTNKHMKKCSASLVTSVTQTKTMMKYHYKLTKMSKI